MSFSHLHVHDHFSILDGMGTPEKYAKRAKELGFTALATTNHGNVDNAIKFQNACRKEGIQPIIGCELYIVENIYKKIKGEKRKHITAWVYNNEGWKNLLQILSIANIEGYYYRPRIDSNILLNHYEGLIIGTACANTFIDCTWGLELFYKLKEKTDVYLEVMPFDSEEQKRINNLIMILANSSNTPIIATNDCHYIKKEDSIAQETLLAIQSKKKWSDSDRWKFNVDGLYLRTEKEMVETFKKQDILSRREIRTAMNNTQLIVDKCKNFTIEKVEVILPRVPMIEKSNMTDLQYLKKLIEEGFAKKVIKKHKDISVYKNRVKEEFELIKSKGFERYFLMVWEVIEWANEQGIMTGPGRGSAGGSLICYLLGITKVDPIKFGLMFFRFINPGREDFPDIDSDFSDSRRDEVINHLKDLYGKNHVAGISTFGFLGAKSVIRDIGRVFELDGLEINMIAKSITDDLDVFFQTQDGHTFERLHPREARICSSLEGTIRSRGQHACGTVVSRDDLMEGDKVSLTKNKKNGDYITNWDKHDIEHQGLMKFDILGLNALSVLDEAKRLIKENHNVNINFEMIPLEDKRVLRRFTRGDNIGCFQLNTYGLKEFCKKLKIDSFMDIVHATALYRPGTLGNGTADDFIERKHGRQSWDFIHPLLEPITGYTYGIILYQEQIMQFIHDIGGLDWKITNEIRKVVAKSKGADKLMEYRDMFVEGCLNKGTLDKETAKTLFNDLASFGAYGFNLSHAVEYSHITYWDQWLKIYYPKEFYCANLTYGSSVEKIKEELILDAVKNKIEVRSPKIGKSDAFVWKIVNDILYAPFKEIKGIGDKTAEKVMNFKIKNEVKTEPKIQGFFVKPSKKIEKTTKKSKAKYQLLLEEIHAYDDNFMTVDEAYKIQKYFGYLFRK